MLVVQQERPRNLRWYLTAPMLYGDWGTSRFYVLGLAFFYSLHASFYYVFGVCVLMAAVGWAYTVICRSFPDGGGVYSAARKLSPTLAVIGALLLFADYIVTAALSALDAIHYFGLHEGSVLRLGPFSMEWVPLLAIMGIFVIGIINYVGTKNAGKFALLVALCTIGLTFILALFTLPHLAEGWQNIRRPQEGMGHQWLMLVNVVLALSGVEAVANMTGVMVKPISKTSKKTIYPVLIEVVFFNLIFAVGMNALPHVGSQPIYEYERQVAAIKHEYHDWQHNPYAQARIDSLPRPTNRENQIKNAVLRVMGAEFVHPLFGAVTGVVFGLLLFSAVNTAVGGMISIQYAMSRDRELPVWFSWLNFFGVPWVALIPAVLIPAFVLVLFNNLENLADLYAIGVVGAIAINLSSCTINPKLRIRPWERAAMGVLGVIMIGIEATLAYEKPHALLFASIVLGLGLGLRFITRAFPALLARVRVAVAPGTAEYQGLTLPWLTPSQVVPALASLGTPAEQLDMSKPKLMVATRGNPRTLEFAANYAKQTGSNLFVVFIRPLNVSFETPGSQPSIEEDVEARRVMDTAARYCKDAAISMIPIYAVSNDVPATILDFAATYNVSTLMMGVSQRNMLVKTLKGDTITEVANQLPAEIPLLIHA